jgi:hypothetical protein
MAIETTVLLRTILYQLMDADSLEDAIHAVKVMCSKDDIAAVQAQLEEKRKKD